MFFLFSLVDSIQNPQIDGFLPLFSVAEVQQSDAGVDAKLRSIPLFIRRAPLKPVQLEDLAFAVRGSIVQTKSGKRTLSRSKDDLSSFNEARRKWRESWIRRTLQHVEDFRTKYPITANRIAESLQASLDTTSSNAKGGKELPSAFFPGQLLPTFLYLRSSIQKISPERLALIPDDGSSVWEDNPGTLEMQLPEHQAVDREYLSARLNLHEEPFRADQTDQFESIGEAASFANWGTTPTTPAKVRLSAYSFPSQEAIILETYDSLGKKSSLCTLYAMPRDLWLSPYFLARKSVGEPDDIFLQMPAEALSFAIRSQRRSLKDTAYWVSQLSSGKLIDRIAGNGVSNFDTENKDKSFIFVGEDNLWSAISLATDGTRLNLSFLRRLLFQYYNYEVVKTPTSVIWRPAYELPGQNTTADLAPLLATVNAALKEGNLTIQQLCRFEHSISEETALTTVARDVLRSASSISQPVNSAPPQVLSFLGGMTDQAWVELLDGSPRTMDELGATDNFKKLLMQDVLRVTAGSPTGVPDLYQHSMELYQDVGCGQTRLQITKTALPLIGVYSKGKTPTFRWLEYGSVQNLHFLSQRMNSRGELELETREEWEDHMDRFYTFSTGVRPLTNFVFYLPMDCRSVIQFADRTIDNGTLQSYKDLPIELRDRFWNAALSAPNLRSAVHPIDSPPPPPPPPPR